MNGISLIIFEIGDYGYLSRSTYTFLMDGLVIKKLLLLAVFKLNVNIFMNYRLYFYFLWGWGTCWFCPSVAMQKMYSLGVYILRVTLSK